MNEDQYLKSVLARERVDTGDASPVRGVQKLLGPVLLKWSRPYLRHIVPSGSFAKQTANKSGTDIDLFISLKHDVPNTLEEISNSLTNALWQAGYAPSGRNVAINIRVNGYDVDLIPARHQGGVNEDHSLYTRKNGSWIQTNVRKHIVTVRRGLRISEIRLMKLWRDQHNLELPSFYLELTTIEALKGSGGGLAKNVVKVLTYIRDHFPQARVIDPANTNNVISDELNFLEKVQIAGQAAASLGRPWTEFVR
jgi:hypothetical protein